MRHKVLLVEQIHPAGEAMLAEKAQIVYPSPQNREGILAAIGDCSAIVVRNTRITREIIEAGPRLLVIGRHGVGYDTVDVEAAAERGVTVVYTPAANTESVAELAAGLIIALARRISLADRAMQAGELISDKVTMSILARDRGLIGFDLWGKTLGIVGVGRIGSSLARKMGSAFGMKVLGYDPYVDAETLAGYGVCKMETLSDMLPLCDVVSLNCSGGAGTRHLINAATLSFMKQGAYLVNTSRGTVVDEKALLAALDSGRLAGAALDVYDPEPPLRENPLLHREDVICTPHLGAMTTESLYNMATTVAQGVLDVLEGRQPRYVVSP